MKTCKAILTGMAIAITPALCQGATVTLTTGDGLGASSIDSAGNWSDSQPPSAANDYQVAVKWLRTPGSGDVTFAGNSLEIQSGGGILTKNAGAQTLTVPDLVLSGPASSPGYIRSGAGSGDIFTLAGNLTIASGEYGGLIPDQSPFIINSSIAGGGTLVLANNDAAVGGGGSGPGRGIDFAGVSTFTGNVAADALDMVWLNGSSWSFSIGANGANNAISGAGDATFDGSFNLDLSGAGTTVGDSWTLTSVASQTYGTDFSIPGFTDQGNGTWAGAANGADYVFNTANGVLSVVPEPGSVALLLSGIGALALFRRRR